jgi:hypothetical protein
MGMFGKETLEEEAHRLVLAAQAGVKRLEEDIARLTNENGALRGAIAKLEKEVFGEGE